MALYLLFESASGYYLFDGYGLFEIGQDFEAVKNSVLDFTSFGKIVMLVACHPFASALDALSQRNAISEGIMTEELGNFLPINLPKVIPGKPAGFSLDGSMLTNLDRRNKMTVYCEYISMQTNRTTEREEKLRPWAELHESIIVLIMCRLSVLDYLHFPSVCQAWRDVHLSNRSTTPPAPQIPCLMIQQGPTRGQSISPLPVLYNLSEDRFYHLQFPDNLAEVGCPVGNGWLILREEDGFESWLLLNPVSGQRVGFYYSKRKTRGPYTFSLSSHPTEPDCVHVIKYGFEVRLGRICKQWTSTSSYCSNKLSVATGMPQCNGKFYVMKSTNRLLIIDPYDFANGDEVYMDCTGMHAARQQYAQIPILVLAELHGEIIQVLVCKADNGGIEIHVFRADLDEKAWVQVWSLGGRSLFIDCHGGLASAAAASIEQRDRIYLAYSEYFGMIKENVETQWLWLEYNMKDGAVLYGKDPMALELGTNYRCC